MRTVVLSATAVAAALAFNACGDDTSDNPAIGTPLLPTATVPAPVVPTPTAPPVVPPAPTMTAPVVPPAPTMTAPVVPPAPTAVPTVVPTAMPTMTAEPAPVVSPECAAWDILTVFEGPGSICVACHSVPGGPGMSHLFVSGDRAATIALLSNVPSTGPSCAGEGAAYVVPGEPENSLLLDYMSGTHALCSNVSDSMTTFIAAFGSDPNNAKCLSEWIAAGAQ